MKRNREWTTRAAARGRPSEVSVGYYAVFIVQWGVTLCVLYSSTRTVPLQDLNPFAAPANKTSLPPQAIKARRLQRHCERFPPKTLSPFSNIHTADTLTPAGVLEPIIPTVLQVRVPDELDPVHCGTTFSFPPARQHHLSYNGREPSLPCPVSLQERTVKTNGVNSRRCLHCNLHPASI